MDKQYPGQTNPSYVGKVRIISEVGNLIVAETTNQISAFDVVLPIEIPRKGCVLNLLSAENFNKTKYIIENCLVSVPHPRFSILKKTEPFKFEVIVRGYNTGSFFRNYSKTGERNPWGYNILGVAENEMFAKPLITPTTKTNHGMHDEDIAFDDILTSGLATADELDIIKIKAEWLFERASKTAQSKGLLLVDTKYEFGKDEKGNILLIDEVHTPDSSRYWYENTYLENLSAGKSQRQLSKEFVRQWLIERGFQGRPDDIMPELTGEFAIEISERYMELYEKLVGPVSPEELEQWDNDVETYDVIVKALRAAQ